LTLDGDFLIAFGSETGQSEAIARIIEDRAHAYRWKPRVHVLNDFGKKFLLEKEPLVVIVCSSTGDGDPPENAVRFVRYISRRTLPSDCLHNVTYALLGLGDSNFSTYQGNPRLIDKHLSRLGAKKLIETGAADDQIGLELDVEPWLARLFVALKNWFRISDENMEQQNCVSVIESDMRRLSLNEKDGNELFLPKFSGAEKLQQDSSLRVPVPIAPFLASCLLMLPNAVFFKHAETLCWQNGFVMAEAVSSQQYQAHVVGVSRLTSMETRKPKQEVVVEVDSDAEIAYEPGDAFYFAVPNPQKENFINRYRMGFLEQADQKCIVTVKNDATRRNPVVPSHIPESSTLRYIFTHCLDIRRSPGRPLLRVLAEFTNDESQKRRILELCSAQGVEEFTKFVRQVISGIYPPFCILCSLLPCIKHI
uniref:Flavodoxin-like domain-containing protein n=1 Tax=Gongylonema pulchrum TaxID=637853 RepID=A0A183CVS2_9BILA